MLKFVPTCCARDVTYVRLYNTRAVTSCFKVVTYSFTIARAHRTKAQVIFARS